MKSIYDIVKEILGVEVPADKKEAFDKEWKENYRTKEEYGKAVQKRDEYKTSLDDVQAKLDAFKDVDVDDLKGQISTLTKNLQDEKDARARDAAKAELEKNVDTFLGSKKFVNDITRDALKASLLGELDKDSAKGKSIDEIFKGLITDQDGKQKENILIDERQQQREQNRARFTQPMGAGGKGGSGKYSMSELMKMANDGVDVSQYMTIE